MKKVLKQNDGYALAYVLVVLLVLAAIAFAVMTLSLNALERQQSSLNNMKDKYAAQGMVEQVVAQMEHADDKELLQVLAKYTYDDANPERNPYCEKNAEDGEEIYTVIAQSTNTKVTATFTLTEIREPVTIDPITPVEGESDESGESQQPTEEQRTKVTGHTVTYLSYKTEYISPEEVPAS